ncbi:MAG TPA: TlpA disulfide reductase family protein [Alphaproteobacteria bacterium]|nr:TlpA disulfide reductase family protein [Alphaproteobacteria bacterium]
MTMTVIAAALVLAAIGGGALVVSGKSERGSTPDRVALPAFRGEFQDFSPASPPQPAPDVAFLDEKGRRLQLSGLKGQVTLVNFWATWCAPCVTEMTALDRLQKAFKNDGLTVLALSQDRTGLAVVEPFYKKLELRELAMRFDSRGEAARALAIRELPVTILIDRQGRELGRLSGPAAWDSDEAKALIKAALVK